MRASHCCWPIDIDPEPIKERLTAWGGAALLIKAIRPLDVPGSSQRNLRMKQRQRGYREAEYVESSLNCSALKRNHLALFGDCGGSFTESHQQSRESAEICRSPAPLHLGHAIRKHAAKTFIGKCIPWSPMADRTARDRPNVANGIPKMDWCLHAANRAGVGMRARSTS
jgi:hypothetical protein